MALAACVVPNVHRACGCHFVSTAAAAVPLAAHSQFRIGRTHFAEASVRWRMSTEWVNRVRYLLMCPGKKQYYVNDARYATLIVVVAGVGLTHPWCVLSVMCGARENETMQQS